MSKFKYFSLISLISVFSLSAYSLVDYTDTSETKVRAPKESAKGSSGGSTALIWKSDFSIDTNYEIVEIDTSKVGLMNIGTHFQTPFNVYFDASFWQGKSDGNSYSGNPKLILGFNWFRVGNQSDMASLNLYGGAILKSNSQIASSHTDKIFGIETTKKFGTMGLGIGFDATLVGRPNRATDMSTGAVHRIEVSGGWMATNDIQFELTAENFRIKRSSETDFANRLEKELSFSTISPKLNLQIFNAVNFELGARYPMKKAKSDQNLSQAKLINYHGAYGSSVFAGLNFTL